MCFGEGVENTSQGCELLSLLISLRVARMHVATHSFAIVYDDINNLKAIRKHVLRKRLEPTMRRSVKMCAILSRLLANEICAIVVDGKKTLRFRHRAATNYGEKTCDGDDQYPPHVYCHVLRAIGEEHLVHFPSFSPLQFPDLNDDWWRVAWPWQHKDDVYKLGWADMTLHMLPSVDDDVQTIWA